MPKQTLTTVLEVPEGWELTGELRVPQDDEPHLDDGCVRERMGSRAFAFPILRPTPRVPKVGEVWEQDGRVFVIARSALGSGITPNLLAIEFGIDAIAWSNSTAECGRSPLAGTAKFLASTLEEWAKGKYQGDCETCEGYQG